MHKIFRSRVVAVATGALVVVGLGTTSGYAAAQITSAQIANGTIQSRDIADGGVHGNNLSAGLIAKLDQAGTPGTSGASAYDIWVEQGNEGTKADFLDSLKGVQGEPGENGTNGRDGVANLIAGAGYHTTWEGDGGENLQTVRQECPAGQYALGGGYSTWGGDKDLGGDNKNIRVTVSAPYFEGEYVPVDAAGNFRPTEWVVKGYNFGDTPQIVRAWVTCADILH